MNASNNITYLNNFLEFYSLCEKQGVTTDEEAKIAEEARLHRERLNHRRRLMMKSIIYYAANTVVYHTVNVVDPLR
jgi:hypothetical protein